MRDMAIDNMDINTINWEIATDTRMYLDAVFMERIKKGKKKHRIDITAKWEWTENNRCHWFSLISFPRLLLQKSIDTKHNIGVWILKRAIRQSTSIQQNHSHYLKMVNAVSKSIPIQGGRLYIWPSKKQSYIDSCMKFPHKASRS